MLSKARLMQWECDMLQSGLQFTAANEEKILHTHTEETIILPPSLKVGESTRGEKNCASNIFLQMSQKF